MATQQLGCGRTLRGVLSVVILLAGACGPVPPKQSDDIVPKDLIPAGFEQTECHFDRTTQPEQGSGGLSPAMGSAGGVVSRANDSAGGGHPAVKCQHVENHHFEQCLDSDGHEHPLQWCHDRQAGKPTSALPHTLCGDPEGVLHRCDDEG